MFKPTIYSRLIVAALLVCSSFLTAQAQGLSSLTEVRIHASDRLAIDLEAHYWYRQGVARPWLIEHSPSLEIDINPRLILGVGYSYLSQTLPARHMETESGHSAWTQAIVNLHASRRLEIHQRIRLEQTWLHEPHLTADPEQPEHRPYYEMTPRTRLRTSADWELKDGWYLFAADEVFLNLGRLAEGSGLDENRLFIALGYHWKQTVRLEGGFQQQWLWREGHPLYSGGHIAVQLSLEFGHSRFLEEADETID